MCTYYAPINSPTKAQTPVLSLSTTSDQPCTNSGAQTGAFAAESV